MIDTSDSLASYFSLFRYIDVAAPVKRCGCFIVVAIAFASFPFVGNLKFRFVDSFRGQTHTIDHSIGHIQTILKSINV